jgi:hypothetical protein
VPASAGANKCRAQRYRRRETVEHPFGTLKARMGATHFLMKTLPRVSGETPTTPDALQAMLRPFPAERMEAHAIGPDIGNVRNDNAGLIERLKSA